MKFRVNKYQRSSSEAANTAKINCQEDQASLLSRLFFNWVTPLITHGWSTPVQAESLPEIEMDSESIAEKFQSEWNKELQYSRSSQARCVLCVSHIFMYLRRLLHWPATTISSVPNAHKPNLLFPLYRLVSKQLISALLARLATELVPVCVPILVKLTTTFAQHKRAAAKHDQSAKILPLHSAPPDWQGYLLVLAMFALLLLYSWSFQWFFYKIGKATVIIRSALISAVYRKSLVLSAQARSRLTLGRLTTLVSTDIGQIERGVSNAIICITVPVQVIASIVVLVFMIGPTGIIGWALVLGFVPVQLWVSRYLVTLRKRAIEYTDARIRATREALQGIKVVKAFAWETSIMQSVQQMRSKEIRLIAQLNLLRYSLISLALHSPVFASILTFGVLVLLGTKLKTGPIFATIGIFNSMSVPLSWFPVALTETRNSLVPLERITEALLEDELEHRPTVNSNLDAAVKIVGGSFRWDQQPDANQSAQSCSTSQANVLKDITLKIPHGSLVIIIGSVGSGKSSLANAIVGEMDCVSGSIEYGGTLAYGPQVPWMMSGTIRDNILFGKPFDPEKYQDVIEACELEADLACFPAGDQTEIGGKNLSGGQKQRLSIARVAYSESDISVLDDCLSAVDIKTSRAIFRQCIKGLLASKTRILVTSSLDYLAAADFVVAMDGGRIAECGTFVDLMAAGGVTAALYNTDKESNTCATDSSLHTATPIRSAASSGSRNSSNISIGVTETTESDISTEKKAMSTSACSGRLIDQEERKTGQISWATYAAYVRASGGILVIIGIMLCLALSQGCRVGSDFWMRLWIHHQGKDQTSFYIGLYTLLGILQFMFFGAFAAILVYSVHRSSKNLHAQAFRRVLYSPMSFFDTTPLGRILNRFTRDIDSLDMSLCDFARQFYQNIGRSIGSFVSISILVPMFLIPLVPLVFASWGLIYVYLRTSVEIQRITAISRSPLYSHYTETLQGLATIRAFGAQQQYISKANQVLDNANRPHWYSLVIQSWIWLRVDYLSHLLTLVICMIIVAQPTRWDAAAVGLMLVQATQMGAYATYAGRGWSELQNNMNSVERINYYATALEQEANSQNKNGTALSNKLDSVAITMRPITTGWPERGTIIIRSLSLQYRPGLPLALDNIDMEIYSGERIGIVGRSGAGKSSILMALFRLVEPSSGRIFIDGIDTQTISLSRLRQSIGLLPQDPVLFEGTVRSNLDPFHTFDDTDLWTMLRRVYLSELVSQHPLRLDMPVDEGGDNFSVGQKQLLCLARVLLRSPRILVLDEATASVDHKTDAAIQQIIANWPEITVISIAHRLQTVATYDRIYVVDNGQIVESGTPLALLEQFMIQTDSNDINANL